MERVGPSDRVLPSRDPKQGKKKLPAVHVTDRLRPGLRLQGLRGGARSEAAPDDRFGLDVLHVLQKEGFEEDPPALRAASFGDRDARLELIGDHNGEETD